MNQKGQRRRETDKNIKKCKEKDTSGQKPRKKEGNSGWGWGWGWNRKGKISSQKMTMEGDRQTTNKRTSRRPDKNPKFLQRVICWMIKFRKNM